MMKFSQLPITLYSQICLQHKAVWGKWDKGEPVDHWYDDEGNICIKYTNGEWFHYRMNPGDEGQAPFLSWW